MTTSLSNTWDEEASFGINAKGETLDKVERKAPAKGGYYTLGSSEYFINEPLYSEVVQRDNDAPMTPKGDREFASWLRYFLNEHKIKAVTARTNTRSLSSYWNPSKSWGGKNNSADTIKKAVVLRAMRTVVGVVDPEHKLTVQYTENDTSAWDSKSKVALPIAPVENIKDVDDCVNVEAGFAIHEAFHSIETRKLMNNVPNYTLRNLREDNPALVFAMNLAEDMRIEDIGFKQNPGYRRYLNITNDYIWDQDKIAGTDPWPEGEDRLTAAVRVLRYGDRLDEFASDPSYEPHVKWIGEWSDEYIRVQGQKTSPSFETCKEYGKKLLDYLDIKPSDTTPQDAPSPCMMNGDDGEEGMDDEDRQEIEDLIEQEVQQYTDPKQIENKVLGNIGKFMGRDIEAITIAKPSVPKNVNSAIKNKSDLVKKAEAALQLRKVLMQNDTRLMKNGELDEDELYRIAVKDYRVFKDATVETLPTAAIYMLVDMSGSMGYADNYGSPAYYATRMAQVLAESMMKNPNVKVKVLGHTGDDAVTNHGATFYRIWEEGDPLNRLSILYDDRLYGDNYDGYAIAWAGKMLKEEQADQKILIVLSDGYPAGCGYGGPDAQEHVLSVTTALERSGLLVVQLAVGSAMTSERQRTMFKHTIPFADFGTALKSLTRLLKRYV